jgi:hypothetical protein
MRNALRSRLLFAALFVGLVAACGESSASSKIEGVYLSSIQFMNKYGSTLDYQFYILYKDGKAFNGVPPGGPEAMDLAAAEKVDPTTVGTWKESGGTVTIAWGGGREASVFPRKPDGSLDLKRGISTRLVPLPEGGKLTGTYSRMSVGGGKGAFGSTSTSIAFRPDGTFSGSYVSVMSIAGIEKGSVAERKGDGTYSIKGYTITLGGGGAEPASLLFATYKSEPPTSPEIVYLGGGYMLQKK